MGDLVNLRQARKRKVRAERETEASANRTLFGRTRAEREGEEKARKRALDHIEGHRRDESKT